MGFPVPVDRKTTFTDENGAGDYATHTVNMPKTSGYNGGILVAAVIGFEGVFDWNGFIELGQWAVDIDTTLALAYLPRGNPDQNTWDFQIWNIAPAAWRAYAFEPETIRNGGSFPPQVAVATGTSANRDAPNLVSSEGIQDHWWAAFAAFQANQLDAPPTSWPANFTDTLWQQALEDRMQLVSAERQQATSSQDPGAFVGTTSEVWTAITVLVHEFSGIETTEIISIPYDGLSVIQGKFAAYDQVLVSGYERWGAGLDEVFHKVEWDTVPTFDSDDYTQDIFRTYSQDANYANNWTNIGLKNIADKWFTRVTVYDDIGPTSTIRSSRIYEYSYLDE